MIKSIATVSLISLVGAFANSAIATTRGIPLIAVTCLQDRTPLDGARTELNLSSKANGFEVILTSFNPWTNKTVVRATASELACDFGNDAILSSCELLARTAEQAYAGVEISAFTETKVSPGSDDQTTEGYRVTIYSPSSTEPTTYDFKKRDCKAQAN